MLPTPVPSFRLRHTVLRARRGFTLIEMFTVLVMMALVSMIGMRSIGRTIDHDRVNKAARFISGDLERTFALAAQFRAPMMFYVDTAARRYLVAESADTLNKQLVRRKFGASDLNIKKATATPVRFDVFPTGLATSAFTMVIYAQDGYTKTIAMSKGGTVVIR